MRTDYTFWLGSEGEPPDPITAAPVYDWSAPVDIQDLDE